RVTGLEADLWDRRRRSRLQALRRAQANRASLDRIDLPPAVEPYDAWMEVNGWNPRREGLLRRRLGALVDPPLLSVILPVYNPPPEFLDKAIQSVVNHVYEKWELCRAAYASTDP